MIISLLISFYFQVIVSKFNKPYPDIGLHESTYVCSLDSKVNPSNYLSYKDEISQIWGSSCGRNRGIFVTDPPDGHTYSCGKFPPSWGIKNVEQMNDFTSYTPEQGVHALDQFIRSVYRSSIDKDIGACDFESLSEFVCGREDPWRTAAWYDKIKAPIRAVNIGGLFVLERWITPNLVQWGNDTGIIDQHSFSEKCTELGNCDVLRDHWYNWYTQEDFNQMKKFELNSIRLPVGYWYFEEISGYSSSPYLMPKESIFSPDHPITKIIRYAKNVGLQVIIDLHAAPGSQNGFDNSGETTPYKEPDFWGEHWLYDSVHMAATLITIEAMTTYINYIEDGHGLDNVMAFEILNEPWQMLDLGKVRDFYHDAIERIRNIRPGMPVILHDSFRPYKWGTMLKNWPFDNVYMDNHAYHAFNIADIASESPEDDRQKLYVHEKIACTYKSQLHFQTCNVVPVLVGEFSIAIDNCMPHLDARYADYGQCRDIASRLESPWWIRHIKSFAMRQISTAERELGWAFWTYKLDTIVEETEPSSYFWSFRLAAKKGFVDKSFYGRKDACLYAPISDYELGDDIPKLTTTQKHHNNTSLPTSTTSNSNENNDLVDLVDTNTDNSNNIQDNQINQPKKKTKSSKKNQDNEVDNNNLDGNNKNNNEITNEINSNVDNQPLSDNNNNNNNGDENSHPINPVDKIYDSTVETSSYFSNYVIAFVMLLFIVAIGTVANQRLRDAVTSVGGYSSVTQNDNNNNNNDNSKNKNQRIFQGSYQQNNFETEAGV